MACHCIVAFRRPVSTCSCVVVGKVGNGPSFLCANSGTARRMRLPRPADGVTASQLLGFYALVSLTIAIFVFINAAQPTLLLAIRSRSSISTAEHPDAGENSGDLGDISGTILVAAEVTALGVGMLSGMVSDGIGRRLVFGGGLVVCALATAACPSSTTFAHVLACRIAFSVGTGSTATMITALLADYVHVQDKGRGAGLVGAAAGFGAVFGALVLMRVPEFALQASAGTLSEAAAVAYGYYTSSLLALGGSVATLCVLTDAPVVAAAGDSGASERPLPDVELRPCTGVEAESGTRARDTSVSVGGAGETRSLPLSSALVAARCEVGWREGLAVVRNDRQLLFALLASLVGMPPPDAH